MDVFDFGLVQCTPVLVVCSRSGSPPGSRPDCLVATSLMGWNLVSQLSGVWQSCEPDEPEYRD